MFDKQIKSQINRSKAGLTDQKLELKIKSYINISKARTTDKKID